MALALAVSDCGGALEQESDRGVGWTDRPEVRSAALSVRWSMPLGSEFPGAFIPVEYAVADLDPKANQLFVGSTAGYLLALTLDGKVIYRYQAGAPIEAAPAVDLPADRIYLATSGGFLDALRARDGKLLWRAKLAGPVRRAPLLSKDAIYVATEADTISALARNNGEVLWVYRREATEGFSIGGHAGALAVDDKLITSFSDGMVVALDAGDGRVIWERDTSLDLEDTGSDQTRFLDVDTTPVKVGDAIYAASFTGGLYALSPSSGAILWRAADLKGITSLAVYRENLLISSAEKGVLCVDLKRHAVVWRHAVKRGAPGEARVAGGLVFVGESEGAFLALSLRRGREVARVESGHGFSAPATVAAKIGFAVSNGGTLFAFSY